MASSGASDRFLEEIEEVAETRLRDLLTSPLAKVLARSVQGLSEQVRVAYLDRFLFELVQNAHDAMDADRGDGRIEVCLTDPGDGAPFGLVTVANTGKGLDRAQFDALTSLAQSSKPPGEGIGNKGVGFRSVLQVSDSPQIFSTDPANQGRRGYTFRLATRDDVLERARGPEEREHLQDMPADFVPIAEPDIPDDVSAAWGRGFATVIRLRLRSRQAREAAERALRELLDDEAPVHLFLSRAASIEVRRPTGHALLTRDVAGQWRHDGSSGSLVTLNGSTRYLLVSRTEPERAMREAIGRAAAAEALTGSWSHWRGDATVEVAVLLGGEPARGRMYTYLPMARASRAPMHGHVNGPFFTDLDRKALNLEHPLNADVVRWVARLCLDAVEHVRRGEERFGPAPAADLMWWDPDDAPCWAALGDAAAHQPAEGLRDLPIVPTGKTEPAWSTLGQARAWPCGAWKVLDQAAAESAGASGLIRPGLGDARMRRLTTFAGALGQPIGMPPEEHAAAVERIASGMLAAQRPIPMWDTFYTELADMFHAGADALHGRRVLLTGSQGAADLAAAGAPGDDDPGPVVFFAPRRAGPADDQDVIEGDLRVEIPATLRRFLVFMDERLTWYDAGTRRPGRAFLDDQQLVNEYRAEGVARLIRKAMLSDPDRDTAMDALRLAFALYCARSYARPGELFGPIGLQVPTAGGMAPADRALFSGSWPGTSGADLALLAGTSPERSPALHGLAGRLLRPPEEVIPDAGDKLTEFLRLIGVVDALPLQQVQVRAPLPGGSLTSGTLPSRAQVPAAVAAQWARSLPDSGHGDGQRTPLRPSEPVWSGVGQGDHGALSRLEKHAYARLLIRGMETWDDAVLATVWAGGGKKRETATPLTAFVEHAAWLPSSTPGHPDGDFVDLSKAWDFADDRAERRPARLVPLLDVQVRGLLDANPRARARLADRGLRTWNGPGAEGAALQHLGELLRDGRLPPELGTTLDAECRAAWRRALQQNPPAPLPEDGVWPFLAGQRFVARDAEQLREDKAVVVDDNDPPALRTLIREYEMPRLRIRDRIDAATGIAVLGSSRAVMARELDLSVHVDGAPVRTGEGARLAGMFPWLLRCVLVILRHPGAAAAPGEDRRRAATKRFDAAVVVRGEVQVRLLGRDRTLPDGFNHILAWSDETSPALIMTPGAPEDGSWDLLQALPWALCELLDVPRLADRLDAVLLRLKARGVQPSSELRPQDLAHAARVSTQDVEAALAQAHDALDDVWRRLRPLLVHYGADPGSLVAPSSAADLAGAAAAIEGRLPCSAADFLERVRGAATGDDARQRFGIGLADINDARQRLGLPPISKQRRHREDLEARLAARRPYWNEWVRAAYADRLGRFERVEEWQRVLRTTVDPDPAWATTLDEVPAVLLDERIARAFEAAVGRPLPPPLEGVEPMEEVTQANERYVRERSPELHRLVQVWCTRNEQVVPAGWGEGDQLLAALAAGGALAFSALDEAAVVRWAGVLGFWPPDMPPTTDPGRLGLTEQMLNEVAAGEAEDRRDRHRARRLVRIGDQDVDSEDIRAVLRAADGLPDPTGSVTVVVPEALPAMKPARRGARGPVNAATAPHLSDSQVVAIGRVGELVAERWLRNQQEYAYTSSCWVSGIGAEIHPGNRGDDGLGYDFEVPLADGGGLVLFEVKASTGAIGEVELTEGEVLAAQAPATRDRWRLLLVENAMSRPHVSLLPNPFQPEHRDKFRLAGNGIRVRFSRG